MRTTHILALLVSLCACIMQIKAQPVCGPETVIDTSAFEGTAFFNYGCVTRAKTNTYKTAFAVGQTFVGYTENVNRNSTLGFYSRYFLPPFELKVNATQGELLDRIQVNWEIDALGPSPNEGFKIYRDGLFIGQVDANTRNFMDFNVIPGIPYTYCVRGINAFGEGVESCALGFQVPNGTVTGWISTLNGSPVPNASVTLTPMQGFSAKFKDGEGALVLADTANPFLPVLDEDWTISFWIKTDTAGNTPGKLIGMPGLYIRSRPNTGGQNGIAVSTTPGGTAFLAAYYPNHHDAWHHIALTYDGNSNKGRLYFDGTLAAIANMTPVATPDSLLIGELAGPGLWEGRLDELRIYHHKLDELDFDFVMDATASSSTAHLTHYWKMDEELGSKSYDIVHRQILYFCGPEDNEWFDPDRPPVHTAGITNEDGYYRIESASYGIGTPFLATPKKNFYLHRSLKFEKAENDYATLPDFSITEKATLETWINSAGVDGSQCVLSKQWGSNEFRLILLVSGTDYLVRVNINNQVKDYGILGTGYRHIAMTWDSTTSVMQLYNNGAFLGSHDFGNITGNWSDATKPWYLGRRFDGTQPYGGLIDEVAVYDTILPQSLIQNHFQNSRDITEDGLRVYFQLDEGSGTSLSNVGSVLLEGGTTTGTEWSALASHQVIEPHVFGPSGRQITLNPSVTSVDQVDFVDKSTVPVTGYVRFKNTDCFANNVEILVNGQSFSPPIFTDETGKFVIDFDPGVTATLTPKFEDHIFTPAFWNVTNVSSPIAGIVFNDITTRTLVVNVVGGQCERSVVATGQTCIVRVRSADNCLSRELTVPAGQKKLTFTNLPPMDTLTVAVVEHSLTTIYDAFQAQGGFTVDISKQNDTVTFVYTAPPTVEIISGMATEQGCSPPVVVFDQDEIVQLDIRVREYYPGAASNFCLVDTANFHIINDIGEEVLDTTMGNGLLEYNFRAAGPNPSPPHIKAIQFIATTLAGVESSTTRDVIVTGIKSNLATFTSIMPEIPTLILRDPPGDGSSAFLEKGEKICNTTEIVSELVNGFGGSIEAEYTPSINWVVAPLGVGNILVMDPEFGNNLEGQVTFKQLSNNSFETCMSFNERISTSSDDLLVGGDQGADVYMGSAFNVIFGLADEVTFDNCQVSVDQITQVQSGGLATTFVYSEFNIENNILRYLDRLADDPQTSDADSIQYRQSEDLWNAILLRNDTLKEEAEFIRNISFDAGTNYNYSETSTVTSGSSGGTGIDSEVSNTTKFGIKFEDSGVTGTIKFITNTSNSINESTGEEKGITTGYTLADNDPLDQFTVDVKMDTVYKTPVFRTVSGQSSCPWEENTANREWPNLNLEAGFPFVALNVPSNDPAVFKLVLGNESGSHEDWVYALTAVAASNPDGAIIKMNGASLTGALQLFTIPYGTSDTVTITIERGPIEYIYDSLVVALVSECEYKRNLALALPLDHDERFFAELKLGAHFIEPCSEVSIIVPQQEEWVIKNTASLKITASGYDKSETNFELMRIQYRPVGGDGAWINIATKRNPNWFNYNPMVHGTDTLNDVFHDIFWAASGLADGPYELRALTLCSNDPPNNNGYSKILKGKIDRNPPEIIGTPQPSDGVYSHGDEISFTFNEHVNCNKLIPLLDVNLRRSSNNQPIDFDITCFENKIVIVPAGLDTSLENRLIKVNLDTIEDLIGNKFLGTTQNRGIWEFFVDQNELAWLTDSAGITKFDDESKSTIVKIHNRADYEVDFAINSVPTWIHVSPNAGTLVANEIREIQFTASDTLPPGWLSNDVVLRTVASPSPGWIGGNETLKVGVRTICRPPDWEVDPTLYQLTMTMNLRIQINGGSASTDPEDQVAVFIDGQLRGSAKLEQIPNGTYVAFVTVYGNTSDINKTMTYEVFDADACLHYAGTLTGTVVNFTSNAVIGTPNGPRTIITSNSLLLHDISISKGWNWLSFNLAFADPAINSALSRLPQPGGDLIKNQTQFATNNNGLWTGSLTTLGNLSAYLYDANQGNTLKIAGSGLNPSITPIPVAVGWNWIGYIPTYPLPVNTALGSLTPTAGDIIKGQTSFAQYLNATAGWVGNLKTMKPHEGYMLKLTNAGIITYPPQPLGSEQPIMSRGVETVMSYWNVDATQYEHNMTLIGFFEFNGTNATTGDMELGAFVGGEVRGVGEAIYVDALNAYLFFLTSFANTSGEQLYFRLYDHTTGEIQTLEEKMFFIPNYNHGSIISPMPFHLQSTAVDELRSELPFEVRPNPFNDETVCQFVLPGTQAIRFSISDVNGRVVYYTQYTADEGSNKLVWKGCSNNGIPLSNGVYLLRLQTDQGIVTQKAVLQR